MVVMITSVRTDESAGTLPNIVQISASNTSASLIEDKGTL